MNPDVELLNKLAHQPLNANCDNPPQNGAGINYLAPIPLDETIPPEFPPNIFPTWMNDMVEAVAKATETPRELAIMVGLAVVARCCQQKFRVSPEPGYTEPLNIWSIAAMDSGNRKTAVVDHMTSPLTDYEKAQFKKLGPEIARIKSERETLQVRIQALRNQAARVSFEDFENKKLEIAKLEESLPDPPHTPRLWAQDITPEKLGQVMADNDESLALISDEGGIFDILAGRYNGGIPNLDLILQAHSGSSVRVDRGNRPSILMESPSLTIGLSPQPDVLRGLTQKPGFRGRGLLARFLYVLPYSRVGYRILETLPIPPEVITAYSNGVDTLLNIKLNTNEYGEPTPYMLTLSEAAHTEWKEFARLVETDMREGNRFEHIRDWAGKLPGAAARLGGLLHCAEYAQQEPWTKSITSNTIKQALVMAAVLSHHALLTFDMMAADPILEDARRVWRWINRTRKTMFTARECFQGVKGSFRRMDRLRAALTVLVERFYIFEEKTEPNPGRPSQFYFVNPHLTEGWKS